MPDSVDSDSFLYFHACWRNAEKVAENVQKSSCFSSLRMVRDWLCNNYCPRSVQYKYTQVDQEELTPDGYKKLNGKEVRVKPEEKPFGKALMKSSGGGSSFNTTAFLSVAQADTTNDVVSTQPSSEQLGPLSSFNYYPDTTAASPEDPLSEQDFADTPKSEFKSVADGGEDGSGGIANITEDQTTDIAAVVESGFKDQDSWSSSDYTAMSLPSMFPALPLPSLPVDMVIYGQAPSVMDTVDSQILNNSCVERQPGGSWAEPQGKGTTFREEARYGLRYGTPLVNLNGGNM